MKLATLLPINAVFNGFFGILLLLVPGPLVGLYGSTPNAEGTMLFRSLGALFVGLAVMAWAARNAEAAKARDAMVLGLTVQSALNAIVVAIGAANGLWNALAWGQAAVYALFAIGFFMAGRASMLPAKAA